MILLKTISVVPYFGRDRISSWELYDEIMSYPLGHIALNVGAFDVSREGWRMRYTPEAPLSVWVVIFLGGDKY